LNANLNPEDSAFEFAHPKPASFLVSLARPAGGVSALRPAVDFCAMRRAAHPAPLRLAPPRLRSLTARKPDGELCQSNLRE
jgi:hypothetical protein